MYFLRQFHTLSKFSSLFIVSKLFYFFCHYRFHIFMITCTIFFSHLISLVVFCMECSCQGPAFWHDDLSFCFSFLCIFPPLPWSFLLFWHSIVYGSMSYIQLPFVISHFYFVIVYMISMCIFNVHCVKFRHVFLHMEAKGCHLVSSSVVLQP